MTEEGKDGIAEPVLDDNVIYTLQQNAVQEPTELICLTPDCRIGWVELVLWLQTCHTNM